MWLFAFLLLLNLLKIKPKISSMTSVSHQSLVKPQIEVYGKFRQMKLEQEFVHKVVFQEPLLTVYVVRFNKDTVGPNILLVLQCWITVLILSLFLSLKSKGSPHLFCLFLVLHEEIPLRHPHFHPATEWQMVQTTWKLKPIF